MDPVIYINRSSWYYQEADDIRALWMLAANLVHEDMHGHGADEVTAIAAEIDLLDPFRHVHRHHTAAAFFSEGPDRTQKRTTESCQQ